MKNLRISLSLVDGGWQPIEGISSGRELIHLILGDDFGPPPVHLDLEATAEDGSEVRIVVPYDGSDRVHVMIKRA